MAGSSSGPPSPPPPVDPPIASAVRRQVGWGRPRGLPPFPRSQWLWLGEEDGGTDGPGYPIRAGQDKKVSENGFYRKCSSGPFIIFIFLHSFGEDGPSEEDSERVCRHPDEYEICYDTRDISRREIFIYGDECDEHDRPGLLVLAGRGHGPYSPLNGTE